MKDGKLALLFLISVTLTITLTAGCRKGVEVADASIYGVRAAVVTIPPETVPLSRSPEMFSIPMPAATGENVIRNYIAEIDLSNARDGYVMVRYLTKTNKAIKVVTRAPDGTQYIYGLKADGEYEVLPISEGNGYYQIAVYENAFDNKYFAVLETALNVQLTNEFAPFIRPNQYVNYNSNSKTTQKAAELTKGAKNTTERITAIYRYVVKNISYDQQLSSTIQAGYIPEVDKVLNNGKGICFDYAAVVAAMLRSQGIPTKLIVGYRGKDYHAWISTYSNETGWVDGIVYFDGENWKIMDPTLDSYGSRNGNVWKSIGDGNHYVAKYFY